MPRQPRMVLCFPAACALVASLTFPIAVPAQGRGVIPNAACPPEGCITGVSVTPDGGAESHPKNTGPYTVAFFARNTGNVSTPFSFTCLGVNVTCGPVTPASWTLAGGASREVEVQYSVGAINGTVKLQASNGGSATDQGYYTVTATDYGPPAAVTLRNQNGDPNPVRGT